MDGRRIIPFLVVGGGIGGLATALALSRKGYPVHVIERLPELGETGAGLQIAPNGLRVLDGLGVLNKIYARAVFIQQWIFVDAIFGEHLMMLDFDEKFQCAYTYPYLAIHRNDLITILADACRESNAITIETNRKVIAVEDLGDGALVTCADGSFYECNALIGADGLRSVVRKCIIDDSEPTCMGCVAYRGVIPAEEGIEFAGIDNTIRLWLGSDIMLIQYPLQGNELYNQVVAFKSDHYRMESSDWGTEDELEDRFAKTHSSVRRSLARVKRDRRWPLYDRPPTENWMRHHITLLGDSAHPMFPYLAQGACQALEDAVCLADMLASYEGNVDKAFRAYQEVRIPRTARIQHMVRSNGFGMVMHIATVDDQFQDWLYKCQPEKR
jgi:salicylate hydroxylase